MIGNGFNGVILRVNLSTGKTSTEELSDRDSTTFLGGRGLGAALLYREVPPGIDPLGEENKLIFVTGPLTGTAAPGSSKYVVATKSPLTNIYLMSVSSRDFGCQLKKAGFDALIVEGRARSPVYLHINNSQVEILDAAKCWGMATDDTDRFLREELHEPQAKVACIGPAGENGVLYASIINEWRAAGRGGAGAVMGSKNLKAIAVRGSGQVVAHDAGAFAEALKAAFKDLAKSPRTATFRNYGTVGSIASANLQGILPARNWQEAYWPAAAGLSAEVMREKYFVKSTLCVPCVSHCSKLNLVRQGPYAGTLTEGPEYETLYSLGSCCGISDFDAVMYAESICDKLGMDTMSAGVSIAFAMECFEKGILSESDTGGIPLRFGDHGRLGELLHQTAYRRGLGDWLAQGTRRMSEHFGHGSDAFAMHAKGLELGAYDPRALKGMATVYACGPRGGCHHAGGRTLPMELDSQRYDRFADRGKAELTKNSRDERVALDSAILCTFTAPAYAMVARLLSAVTGRDYTSSELLLLGDRVSNLERAFNVREGITRASDILPRRLLEETVQGGPSSLVNLDVMLDEFYAACGWDVKTGIPTKSKLEQLGLSGVAEDLYGGAK